MTLVFGYILTQVGYSNIWPLFGSANQLLSALVLITLCVFLKVTGRTMKTLVPPFVIMLIVTFTALIQRFISLVQAFSAGTGVFMVEGLQLIVAVLLMILGVTIVVTSGKELLHAEKEEKAEKQAKDLPIRKTASEPFGSGAVLFFLFLPPSTTTLALSDLSGLIFRLFATSGTPMRRKIALKGQASVIFRPYCPLHTDATVKNHTFLRIAIGFPLVIPL